MSDSKLVASTPLNPIQPLFLGGMIQTRDVNIMVGSWAIHLNSCKIFKNRDRIMVCNKQVEFVKDDVINHIVTRTSSYWQKIKNAWPSTNIARKAYPRMVLNCQSFCCGFYHFAFCFGVTSHPWTKHVFPLSSCCFEIKRCFFQRVFWQNILIKLQHAKLRLVNPKRLKVFWLQKWLDIC